ncbi:diguanylate cyclase (GGDEF)-like protein [Jezberella montanilacus]|jgi:diguanylate cyclase (GGDEF)-like protein|uniref:Diguanylate cyclase (GGDEF)-like protein n=1 Tax=Jezberella montanilacus TaxID=323426 RepID=A0A2T0XE97_9BURK|nr:sensor domain-containing diguanylate cyclase [Jezberella montanilacus]PRY97231.1 diguanylate cyclase (GGDEF)-like protein [Jezberella montanilacus]
MRTLSKLGLTRNVRLILSGGFVIGIVLLMNATFLIYVLRESAIRDRSQQVVNLATLLAQQASQSMLSTNTVLDRIVDVLQSEKIDTDEKFRDYGKKESTFKLLYERAQSNPLIDVVSLLDNTGNVLNFSRSFPAPMINLKDRDYFEWMLSTDSKATYYGAPVQNKGNGNWVFYFARRLNDQNNHFMGALLVGVSVQVFSGFYESTGKNLGPGSSLSLYREDHTLFTRWPLDPELIGQHNTGDIIRQSLEHVQLDGGALLTKERAFNFNDEMIDRMVSFKRVDGFPFVVGVTLTKSLYLKSWTETYWTVLSSSIVSLVLLLGGMILLIQAQQRNRRAQLAINRDSLTELPNRVIFVEELQEAMVNARQSKTVVAVAFIDIDFFKGTNDTYGHETGDLLLIEIAKRIKQCLRDTDFVGRIGGDEFVVLIQNISNIDAARHLCEKIRLAINQPFYADDKILLPAVSIGLAVYPDHGEDEAKLLGKADRAMYMAKKAGRNRVVVSVLPSV